MAEIIDGRAYAARLREQVAAEAAELRRRHGITPRLDVILVGDHAASRAYVRTKTRMAQSVGITGTLHELPRDVEEAALLGEIARLNADPEVHGILVQLPLPDHIDGRRVLETIRPEKDVDGFHPLNVGRMWSSRRPDEAGLLLPCTPLGCLILLEAVLGRDGLRGRRAVIVGRSNIVGKPMAALLLARDATVTVAHSRTVALPERCREAEVLIAAVGRPGMIRGSWIGEGAVVIDVGINRVEAEDGSSRLVGDVAFEEARSRAAAITPVPGGVGPMTVACLLHNTVLAARLQLGS